MRLRIDSYSIWIVSRKRYEHSHAFDEVALALESAFRQLGYAAEIVRDPHRLAATTIVLGPHLLTVSEARAVRSRLILFNMEQVSTSSPWFTEEYLTLLRAHTVWDYSPRNIMEARHLGVHAHYCGIGYAPALARIERGDEDIDVLFYGSLNPRRRAALDGLVRRGLTVNYLFGTYGEARDAVISRSKITLNLHFYETRVLEVVRVAYLLSNQRCVVSERGADRELERPFDGGMIFVDYDDIARCCSELVTNQPRRDAIAREGFRCISLLPQIDYLRAALYGCRLR